MLNCIKENFSKTQEEIVKILKTKFKTLSKKELKVLLENKTLLSLDKIEKGIIYVSFLGTYENFEISILELKPSAKIKEHEHDKNTEYYIAWKGNDPEPCFIGQSHSLENNTNKTMYVLSIKIN